MILNKSCSRLRRCVILAVALLPGSGCGDRPSVEVTGRAGRDVHDPSAQIVQDQYLIEYTVKNTSPNELIFDRVEERWSPSGHGGGLTQTVLPKGGPWRIARGQSKTFVSGTNGYTLQLKAAAQGRPIEFAFSLYNGDGVVLGPFASALPDLGILPRVDQNILYLKSTDEPLPMEPAELPDQEMLTVSFTRR